MIENHNTKIGEAINIESNRSTFRMYHRRHSMMIAALISLFGKHNEENGGRHFIILDFLPWSAMSKVLAQLWATSPISCLKMISASFGLCSLVDHILFIIHLVGAKGFSTFVTPESQISNLFVSIFAARGLFLNMRWSFTKFLNCAPPISYKDLIPSNMELQNMDL